MDRIFLVLYVYVNEVQPGLIMQDIGNQMFQLVIVKTARLNKVKQGRRHSCKTVRSENIKKTIRQTVRGLAAEWNTFLREIVCSSALGTSYGVLMLIC